MRHSRSTFLRLFIPVLVIVVLAAGSVCWFYFTSQQELVKSYRRDQVGLLSKAVFFTAERRIDTGDTVVLESFVSQLHEQNPELVISVHFLSEGNKPISIITKPGNLDLEKLLTGELGGIEKVMPLSKTLVRNGAVVVVCPEKVIQNEIYDKTYRVLLLIVSIALCSLFIFYQIIERISIPLHDISIFADSLLAGNYSGLLEGSSGIKEIGEIKNSLNNLKITLSKQQSRNRELTSGLEFQVSKRTHELKSLVEKLNAAQEIGRIGNFLFWIDNDLWEFSPNLKKIMGAELDDLTDLNSFLNLLKSDARDKAEIILRKTIAERSRFVLDIELASSLNPNGSWVTISGAYGFDRTNGLAYLSGTIQDVTARKELEAKLDQLALVARLTTNGVIITDANQKILWVNESLTRLTGYDESEILGNTPNMFQSDRTDRKTTKLIHERLLEGQNIRVEIENITKDGKPYWIDLHIEPILDASVRPKGFIAIQIDITERKNYELELKKALEKETELSRAKSKFVNMTSHEFRTPLTTILSTTELLRFILDPAQNGSKEKVERYLGRITSEVDRMSTLMEDILLFGKIEAGKVVFKPCETDLSALLIELFNDRQLVPGDSRSISIQEKGIRRKIVVDPTLMGHIFTNLVVNAIKYSRGAPAPTLVLDYKENCLMIMVTDQGMGIPPEDQKNLFQSFYRASNAENIPGTGMGLAIVKQFVELHGGKVSIRSEEEKGTEVILELDYDNEVMETNKKMQ